MALLDNLPKNVISIDFESIRFFNKDKSSKKYNTWVEMYKATPFTEEFYEMLKGTLAIQNKPKDNRVSLILPDNLFFTDTIKLPLIQKTAMNNSLSLGIDAIYKNSKDIRIKSFLLHQNKQNATYNICGIRKEILEKTVACVESVGYNVACVTYSANATVNGAIALNSKLKSSSYILIDIKPSFTRYSLVANGKTIGFYSLPFGHNAIKTDVVKDEITLFDHTAGDLLVLNATESARKKQLTMINSTEDEDGESENTIFKRTNRKLPKFMLRPEPQSEREFMYENFRVFVKYCLELIRSNPDLSRNSPIQTAIVNIPERFSSVIEDTNANLTDNKVSFERLVINDQPIIVDNLELFGGFYTKKYNKVNAF